MNSEEQELKSTIATQFLLQSPPGEINDVLDDIRTIIQDDNLLEMNLLTTLENYNQLEFIVTKLNGVDILITESSALLSPTLPSSNTDNEASTTTKRLLNPKTSTSFEFDHIKLITSSPLPHPVDESTESKRKELETLFETYVKNHYSEGVGMVYSVIGDENKGMGFEVVEIEVEQEEEEDVKMEVDPVVEEEKVEEEKKEEVPVESESVVETESTPIEVESTEVSEDAITEEPLVEPITETEESTAIEPTPPTSKPKLIKSIIQPLAIKSNIFKLYSVGNKYNPSNFWTGRWKSVYTIDYSNNTLEGTIKINCHYYEQGNVQLSTTLSSSLPFPSNTTPNQLIALIKSNEKLVQLKLAEVYNELSDGAFKNLRRALPKTRSKLDWGKIGGYRLGGELGGGKE